MLAPTPLVVATPVGDALAMLEAEPVEEGVRRPTRADPKFAQEAQKTVGQLSTQELVAMLVDMLSKDYYDKAVNSYKCKKSRKEKKRKAEETVLSATMVPAMPLDMPPLATTEAPAPASAPLLQSPHSLLSPSLSPHSLQSPYLLSLLTSPSAVPPGN